MLTSIKIKSSVTSGNGVKITKDNGTALATFITTRAAIGSSRGSGSGAPEAVVQNFNSIYTKSLSPKLDDIMANAVGARVVSSGKFKGTIFDNIHVDESGRTTGKASETKSINVQVDSSGKVLSSSGISIATGEGINLSRLKGIYTGVKSGIELGTGMATNKNDFLEEESADKIKNPRFLDKLVSLADDQVALKKFLSSKSVPATQLRKNFMLKASEIHIPIVVGGVPKYKSLRWSWSDIVKNPQAKIRVSKNSKNEVFFNIEFADTVIRDALQKAKYENFKFAEKYADQLSASIAKSFKYLTKDGVDYLKNKLPKDVNIDYTILYQQGSILVYQGSFKSNRTQKASATPVNKANPQKFISSAQWTVLVQRRLGDSMLSFGDPEPPEIKERSGRFRKSVDVTANYRTKTIQYTYNPLYRSLEHYGYHPELQVERSIRQVAQDLYARAFSIRRRGDLA